MFQSLLVSCRPGFEKECASELSSRAAQLQLPGFSQTQQDSGFCLFHFHTPLPLPSVDAYSWSSLVFARSIMFLPGQVLEVPAEDRIAPIFNQMGDWGKKTKFDFLLVESADSDSGRELSAFCRSFSKPMLAALKKAGHKAQHFEDKLDAVVNSNCLHIFFKSYSEVYVGISFLGQASPWPRGIPRLRFPSDAPSRSTLKLEEALLSFLSDDERATSLSPARRAVDLGACPGGWTYQFVRRGIRTQAVDNGAMDERLMQSGLVEHLRVDGFKFSPAKPVDWMVCDMVEQPKRVAALALSWWQNHSARRFVFNLKLPMKKRWSEVEEIRNFLDAELGKLGRPYRLLMKQLYHDREEVTVYIGPLG